MVCLADLSGLLPVQVVDIVMAGTLDVMLMPETEPV
jgi:hypothetical protein